MSSTERSYTVNLREQETLRVTVASVPSVYLMMALTWRAEIALMSEVLSLPLMHTSEQ